MKALKSLTFAPLSSAQRNPVMMRRAKLMAHLEEQVALLRDPLHLRTEHRWVIQDNGVKERVEQRRKVRAWWRVDDVGNVYLTARYGARAIEFEKGKSAIVLADKTKLQSALETLIAATKVGELDDQLAVHAKERGFTKPKKVA